MFLLTYCISRKEETPQIIPKLEAAHISTANFVRSHLYVPIEFLATATAAGEQTAELQGVKKLDVDSARDTLQFIHAFRPVLDKVSAFAKNLQFTLNSRKASLASEALQIYDIAKGLARDPNSAPVASLVANMKRDLGRRGRPSGLSKPTARSRPAWSITCSPSARATQPTSSLPAHRRVALRRARAYRERSHARRPT